MEWRNTQYEWYNGLMRAPVTLTLAAFCLVSILVPNMSTLLELDTPRVLAGDWWRLATGHLTHFTWSHLIWDLGVFVGLGYLCESRHRWLTYLTLTCSAFFISAWCLLDNGLDSYRGLSGVDTGLFALLGTLLLLERWRERDWPAIAVLGALMAGMVGKIVWESTTGDCLFVNVANEFTPVPAAHFVGAAVGILLGACTLHAPRGEASLGSGMNA